MPLRASAQLFDFLEEANNPHQLARKSVRNIYKSQQQILDASQKLMEGCTNAAMDILNFQLALTLGVATKARAKLPEIHHEAAVIYPDFSRRSVGGQR